MSQACSSKAVPVELLWFERIQAAGQAVRAMVAFAGSVEAGKPGPLPGFADGSGFCKAGVSGRAAHVLCGLARDACVVEEVDLRLVAGAALRHVWLTGHVGQCRGAESQGGCHSEQD